MKVIDPHVWIPHARGLYRFLPGLVESAGLEREIMNESVIRGRIRAIEVDGQWIYLLVDRDSGGSVLDLLVGRDRRGQEPGFGPMVWDTLVNEASAATGAASMFLSSLFTPPRLFYAITNTSLGYFLLSVGAGAPDVAGSDYRFNLSGKRTSPKYRFGDWGNKDYPKVDVVGKGTLSSARFWDVFFSVDGAAFSATDIDGNTMRVNADGRKTFFLPLTAVGREIQLRFDYTGDSTSAPGEVSYSEPFAMPQSRKLPIHVLQLHLAEGVQHDLDQEVRPPEDQFSDLNTLAESATPLKASGPWGEDKDMIVKRTRLIEILHEDRTQPELLVEVVLQEREVV